MSDLKWRLPGVHSFLQRVTDNLDTGTNVILQIPPTAPAGLLDALSDLSSEDYRHLHWLHVDASEWSATNAVSIANNISLVDIGESAGVTSAEDLASHGRQRVYAIDGISPQCWPVFTEFIELFRRANHQRDENDRDVFLVNTNAALAVPDFDIGLRVIAWRDVVREIDSRLFLEQLVSHPQRSGLDAAIKMSIATELGGSDLNLLETLATEPLEHLISPEPILREFAENCDWCSAKCVSWCDGGSELFRNRARAHSSVVALLKDSNELRKRVWHGQLTIVFPYLEERRLEILPRVKPFLQNSDLRDPQGRATEIEDLELGSLFYFICICNSGAPSSVKDEVRLLRDLRHELAHLRPIPMTMMNRFLRYAESVS